MRETPVARVSWLWAILVLTARLHIEPLAQRDGITAAYPNAPIGQKMCVSLPSGLASTTPLAGRWRRAPTVCDGVFEVVT